MSANRDEYQALRARLDARLREHSASVEWREARAHRQGRWQGLWMGWLIGMATAAVLVLLTQSILFPGFF